MADWRRIQARIRKARSGKDPASELAALHNDTRDAMVAFELARLHEKNGAHAEAAQWYSTAATSFRRAQWKVKAQEALARLGVDVPLAASEAAAQAGEPAHAGVEAHAHAGTHTLSAGQQTASEDQSRDEAEGAAKAEIEQAQRAAPEPSQALDTAAAVSVEHRAQPQANKRRRRGRRGGVRHRKRKLAATERKPEPVASKVPRTDGLSTEHDVKGAEHAARPHQPAQSVESGARTEFAASKQHGRPAPVRSIESADAHEEATRIGPAAWQERQRLAEARARPGEPALASRLAKLESQLRRLLAAPAHRLDDLSVAPAGPGVFVLSDSDLLDSYYAEACQTLRIGVGNLLRGARTREGGHIRAALAEQLGIAEAKVTKYLKDHCAVRWLQLDEGAPMLAHFAIAVLQPSLNE